MTTPAPAGRAGIPPFHFLRPRDVEETLRTDAALGLSLAEAARRLADVGPNELDEKPRPSFLSMLLDQFKDFLVLILVAAAIVSIALGEWVDAGAIILIVVLNAVIGVVQESKAVLASTIRPAMQFGGASRYGAPPGET